MLEEKNVPEENTKVELANNNEPVEEVKPEEAPQVEEDKKEEKAAPQSGPTPFFKLEDPSSFEETVENKRLAFRAEFNKNKVLSRIIMAVVMAALIGAIVLVTLDNQVAHIVGFSIAGAVLVGMIAYYITSRGKFPNKSKAYIKDVTEVINGYVYSDDNFDNLTIDMDKKITTTEFALDRVYKEGIEVGSRNAISGTYKGKKFDIIDAALYFQELQGKKAMRKVGFLGKYLTMQNDYNFEGRYIFNLKGNDPEKFVDQPNDVEDLELVLNEGNLSVYGPNSKSLTPIFGGDFVKKLKKIEVVSPLLNVIVVVWGGHTGVYLSYDDPITTVPFEKEFKKDAQEKFRGDLLAIFDLLVK